MLYSVGDESILPMLLQEGVGKSSRKGNQVLQNKMFAMGSFLKTVRQWGLFPFRMARFHTSILSIISVTMQFDKFV